MAYYHVLLNGTGTSGDGSTWADDSSGTAAFIGADGFASCIDAASAGDTVYVKGTDTYTGGNVAPGGTGTLAMARAPVMVIGVKSTTTNLGASVVESDLIPGLRTSQATRAYDDADVPTITLNDGVDDFQFQWGYYYGIKFVCSDNINICLSINEYVVLEECYLEIDGSGDQLNVCIGQSIAKLINSKVVVASGGYFQFGQGRSEWLACIINIAGVDGIFGNATGACRGHHDFLGCDFSGGAETTIFNRATANIGSIFLENCLFPASWGFAGGTAFGPYEIESSGCDNTTGLTTGGSEQQINTESQHGTVSLETTKVRTGGADDGAAGVYSWDMSTFASGTETNIVGLKSPWMAIWVAGDGTSKTLTVYFTSDSGNTQASDWTNDEVWLEVLYPDSAGSSQFLFTKSQADLLEASLGQPTDDTGSTWGAGTQNDQKFEVSIAPSYEGYVRCRVVFAPGANAETIYVDPAPTLA